LSGSPFKRQENQDFHLEKLKDQDGEQDPGGLFD
jgi:hypothetical protein